LIELAVPQRQRLTFPEYGLLPRGVIVGRTRLLDVTPTTDALRPWEMPGGYALHLDVTTPTKHIRCNGAQKLWELPEEVLDALGETS